MTKSQAIAQLLILPLFPVIVLAAVIAFPFLMIREEFA
jgi:hypothetical protein